MPAETLAALAQLLEPHGVLAWLATYLVHSTLLLAAAWGASRGLRGRNLRLEERLWKAALVGGLLTATIQTGLAALPSDPTPNAGGHAVAAAAAQATSPAAWAAAPSVAAPAPPAAPDPRLRSLGSILPGWQRLALTAWLVGGLLLAGGLALAWLRLRLCLRGREDLATAPAARLLERLLAGTARRRRVRLTGTSALPVPVALGVGEREICLPRRVLRELDEPRQAGLLAHELAHLERRDPAWLLGALALQSVFFFQPLNRLARRRLEDLAELQCDDWAVRATGDRVALARCLTEVASWLVADRSPLPVPGMARTRGHLSARVRRILEGDPDEAARRRWLPAASAAALLFAVVLVPGLAPATLAEPEPVTATTAPAAPATPPAEAPSGDPAPNARPAPAPDGDPAFADGDDFAFDDEDLGVEDDLDADYDFDFDFDEGDLPDPEELSAILAEAMDAARAAMPDPEAMAAVQEQMEEAVEAAMEAQREALETRHEALEEAREALDLELGDLSGGSDMSAAERARFRAEIDRELAHAREEMERALREARPALEEVERVNRELRGEIAASLRQAQRELESAHREALSQVERETRAERNELRRQMEREVRDARRELEQARRELEESRRQLEREKRQLEVERQELERRRAREASPPPAS